MGSENKKYKLNGSPTIPKGWELKTLGELGTFSKGNGITKEQLSPSGLPCIRYGEIYTAHDYVIKKFFSFISQDVAAQSRQIKKNDVLLAGSGETLEDIGKAVAYIGNDEAYAGGDVIIFSPNGETDSVFLSYFLNTNFANRQKRRLGQGHSVVHIYPSMLEGLKILLPPQNEQKKIRNILFTWNKAIETTEQLITKKEKQKRALMQQLLTGKKRIKEFKNEKWKNVTIEKLGRVFSGGTPDTTKGEFFNGKLFWCIPSDITALKGYKYISNTERKITESGLKNSSANLLPKNSLVVCTRATIGDCAINTVPMSANQGFKSIVPNEKVDIEFLYYMICTKKHLLIRLAKGSTFLEISKGDFESIHLKIPQSKQEQKKIVSVLSASDNEIQLLKNKLDTLKRNKKGLMEILLTGKKRVKI